VTVDIYALDADAVHAAPFSGEVMCKSGRGGEYISRPKLLAIRAKLRGLDYAAAWSVRPANKFNKQKAVSALLIEWVDVDKKCSLYLVPRVHARGKWAQVDPPVDRRKNRAKVETTMQKLTRPANMAAKRMAKEEGVSTLSFISDVLLWACEQRAGLRAAVAHKGALGPFYRHLNASDFKGSDYSLNISEQARKDEELESIKK